jgi:thiamine biosynthesis lipoprotein
MLPLSKLEAQMPSAHKVLLLMGSRFEITAVAETDTAAWMAVEAGIDEIRRIEALISSWDERSQTSAINRAAGVQAVVVDQELYYLIKRAISVSELTQGAFDISFASMERIYQFDKGEHALPSAYLVEKNRQKVDYKKIQLNQEQHSIYLLEKGMRIGFGAIGKGYAANRAAAVMKSMPKVKGGVLNASGDLLTWGESTSAEGWNVKIADPKQKDKMIAYLSANDMAVVTSGNYEKFFTSGGKRYAHIIDPRTGYPTTGLSSVTVVCPDAELADALATSLFVLGIEKGLELINALNHIECLMLDDEGQMHSSSNLKLQEL